MKRISSRSTAVFKKLAPVIWFGFYGIFAVISVAQGALVNGNALSLIGLCAVGALGYVVMRKLVWAFVDEVFDAGEFLVVRNRGRDYEIPLTDIVAVSSSTVEDRSRICVRLMGESAAGPLGTEIVFYPEAQAAGGAADAHPVAADLSARADKARAPR
jgi:hypothetical protein